MLELSRWSQTVCRSFTEMRNKRCDKLNWRHVKFQLLSKQIEQGMEPPSGIFHRLCEESSNACWGSGAKGYSLKRAENVYCTHCRKQEIMRNTQASFLHLKNQRDTRMQREHEFYVSVKRRHERKRKFYKPTEYFPSSSEQLRWSRTGDLLACNNNNKRDGKRPHTKREWLTIWAIGSKPYKEEEEADQKRKWDKWLESFKVQITTK